MTGARVEHAQLFAGGSMLIRNADADVERVYPLAEWIGHETRKGGRIFRRKIVVIEDWSEVTDHTITEVM
jgi:hypothetical protein